MREISKMITNPSSNTGEVLESEDLTEDFQGKIDPLIISSKKAQFPSLTPVDYSSIPTSIIKVRKS